MDITFNNKVILITGASTGIGASTAIEFGKTGASVVVNYNSSENEARKVAETINSMGGKAIPVKADVSKKEDALQLVNKTIEEFGKIDVLVNNAGGLLERRSIEEMDESLWDKVMDLNVKSIYLVSQAALSSLKKQKGKIVNISSIAGRNGGGPGAAVYASSKGAVTTLTKAMAKEFLKFGILVNAVNPGVISTPFHDRFTAPEVREGFKKTIPLGREGKPEEIAFGILFLASPFAGYMVGETLEINGGMYMN